MFYFSQAKLCHEVLDAILRVRLTLDSLLIFPLRTWMAFYDETATRDDNVVGIYHYYYYATKDAMVPFRRI